MVCIALISCDHRNCGSRPSCSPRPKVAGSNPASLPFSISFAAELTELAVNSLGPLVHRVNCSSRPVARLWVFVDGGAREYGSAGQQVVAHQTGRYIGPKARKRIRSRATECADLCCRRRIPNLKRCFVNEATLPIWSDDITKRNEIIRIPTVSPRRSWTFI